MYKSLKSMVVFAALLAPLAAYAAGGGGGGGAGGAGAGAAGGAAASGGGTGIGGDGNTRDKWPVQPGFWSQPRDSWRAGGIDPTERAARFQRSPNSGRASSSKYFFVQRQRVRWKFADRSRHAQ